METPSLLRALVDLAGTRRWRIGLGILSLAVGFALVTLASGRVQIQKSPGTSLTDVTDGSSGAGLTVDSCTELSSIELSFNPMPIAEGNFIWFNSAMSVDGLGSDPTTIFLNNSRITFAANGTNYRLPVPDATITFDPGVTEATTSFDAASNRWITIVPGSLSGRAFVSGLAFPVPAGGLPGDVGAVTWSSAFSTDTAGVTAQWQWAAAVYTTLGADYNVLGVKAVDGGPAGQSGDLRARPERSGIAGAGQGNDSVGEPKNLGAFVTGGARGEGGSDFTGSFGTALKVTPCAARMAPEVAGRSQSQPRVNTTLSDRRIPRASGILATAAVGIAVTKTCPATASPNSTFSCQFSVKNLDSVGSVTGLAVKNSIPPLSTTPPYPLTVQCLQNGLAVTTLQPNGATGGTDSCTGSASETAPACSTTQDTLLTDEIDATGHDGTHFVFGFAQQTVTIPACPNRTVGIAVTKTCQTTALPNSTVTCHFTVKNLDSAAGVTNLKVTNSIPPLSTTPPYPLTVQCLQGGLAVASLAAKGDPLDTCTGSVDEPMPACGSGSISVTDEIDATGKDGTHFVFGFAQQTVVIPACTPTPTNTPTPTPTPTPLPNCGACTIGYPFASANPRTSVVFNESEVLAGFGPVDPGTGCLNLNAGNGSAANTIQLFYSDEHALTLGVRQVVVVGGLTTPYPVTAMSANPSHVINPAVGTTASPDGDDTNTCGTSPCGRPLRPVLFVTDTDPIAEPGGPLAGDWQSGGGFANNPDDIFGTWKAAVRTVNGTTITVTPDSDPAGNTFSSLASVGGDPIPAGLTNLGYAAEIRWNLGNLRDRHGDALKPNHAYRFEFMVHDGDQNKTGGDAGENCVTGVIPSNFAPTPTPNPTLTPALTPGPPTATPTRTPTPLTQAKTSVTVSCSPNPVLHGTNTSCTATVTNTTGGAPNGAPLGTSAFTASGGTISDSGQGSPCILVPFSSSVSKCSVNFTNPTAGNQTINANYTSSDLTRWKSAGASSNLTVKFN